MRTVQVYIEGQRLDLFDDEQINVTSTQQNVQDISKVFTDFSQSFSVPASVKNNEIFHHFYENDIGDFNDVNTLFDFNIRRNGNIEIDYTPFRTGKISLEKAEVKNNQAYSYQITFYGDVVSLKDKFSNDKLVDLTPLNLIQHDFNGTEVKNRITDGTTDFTIRYPLIFSRDITYGDGGSTDINPSTGSGKVLFNELFPAIKLSTVFSSIATNYGITFTGTFLSSAQFTKAFLHCQNSDTFVFQTPPELADLTTLGTEASNNNLSLTASDFFSIANDTLTISQFNNSTNFPVLPASSGVYTPTFSFAKHKIRLITSNLSDVNVFYYVDVFLNGQRITTFAQSGTLNNVLIIPNDEVNTPREYKFFVRSQSAITLDLFVQYKQQVNYIYLPSGFISPISVELENVFNATALYTITSVISVLNYLPDITVEKFFKGILQMFNLTCYATEADIYTIEPLTEWYSKGAVVDITEYTDIESINIDRVKLYKNIEFKYEESESGTNTIFRDLTSRGYGNTSINFDYEGGDFKIELPFENMQMQKFVGTNLQIGETINTDANKYTPKPMILYMYDQLAADYEFFTGIDTTQSQYMPFGQDLLDTGVNFTLNFSADISTLLDEIVPNTLYSVYYAQYLSNLYNLKNRETSVKTNLPISLLTSLELNDRLIIRDKRYLINDMKSNLTTGEVDLVLLNDFSDVISEGLAPPLNPYTPSKSAQCLDVTILFPNNAKSATVTTTDAGVTITPSSLTSDGTTSVCIPANTNAIGLISDESGLDNIATESFLNLRTEEGGTALYTLSATYTYANGTTSTNDIIIQQQDR